jgi:hypothetical protein
MHAPAVTLKFRPLILNYCSVSVPIGTPSNAAGRPLAVVHEGRRSARGEGEADLVLSVAGVARGGSQGDEARAGGGTPK